eukprot:6192979-Pleurochrysis_carterae.AAC.1
MVRLQCNHEDASRNTCQKRCWMLDLLPCIYAQTAGAVSSGRCSQRCPLQKGGQTLVELGYKLLCA